MEMAGTRDSMLSRGDTEADDRPIPLRLQADADLQLAQSARHPAAPALKSENSSPFQ
jgi:hypothetical protein